LTRRKARRKLPFFLRQPGEVMRGNHARTIFMAALALSQGCALAAGTGPNLPAEIVEQLSCRFGQCQQDCAGNHSRVHG
jgi:hypothetical protein